MRKIFAMNVATYNAIMDMRGQLPSHLERSLFQEPFILEDGIGRIAPVHMQFITSWEAFDSVLEMRFRGMQGHQMVQNKEYVIQENATRREIGRSHPWVRIFLKCPPCSRPCRSRKKCYRSQAGLCASLYCPCCVTLLEFCLRVEVLIQQICTGGFLFARTKSCHEHAFQGFPQLDKLLSQMSFILRPASKLRCSLVSHLDISSLAELIQCQ